MRLTLIDSTLKDFAGHNAEYARIVAREASEAGAEVRIISHRQCVLDERAMGASVHPWFDSGLKDEPPAPKTVRQFFASAPLIGAAGRAILNPLRGSGLVETPNPDLQALQLYKATSTSINELWRALDWRSGDRVFFPNLIWPEAAHLADIIADGGVPPEVQTSVLLRFDPPQTVEGMSALRGAALRAGDRIDWTSDTTSLAHAYSAVCGCRFETARIPVDWAGVKTALTAADDDGQGPRIGYFGEARTEKGFHYLPDLVKQFRQSGTHANFLLQVMPNKSVRENAVTLAAQRLNSIKNGSNVKLIHGSLSPADLLAMIADCDVILLPYASDRYKLRSSGLLINALALDRIIVAPEGDNWLAHTIMAEQRVDDAFLFTSVQDLAAKTSTAVRRANERQRPKAPRPLISQQRAVAPWCERPLSDGS